MVATVPGRKVLLVLGVAREVWPVPLDGWVERGEVRVERVGTLYEAAVRVGMAAGGERVLGLLLDPCVVMLRDLEGARVMVRHFRGAIVMLPLAEGAGTRAREAGAYGVLPWSEGMAALERLLGKRMSGEGAAAGLADNRGGIRVAREVENAVTFEAANRYDELGVNPIVSAQEIEALLGTLE